MAAQPIHTHRNHMWERQRRRWRRSRSRRRVCEERYEAMRCDAKWCMYGTKWCTYVMGYYRAHVWSSWGCTHLYVRPSPFLKSSVQLRPSCSSNSALLSGLSGLGKLAANVEALPSPIEPFTFDFRLVAPATLATAAALLCAMPNETFTLRQLMSTTTTTTTTTKVNK